MARKEKPKLNWHKGTSQWYRTKTTDGKTKHYWLGKGTVNRQGLGLQDERYEAALLKWQGIADQREALSIPPKPAHWTPKPYQYDEASGAYALAEAATKRTKGAVSVADLRQRFIDHKRAMVMAGQRSAGRLANLSTSLKHFVEFAGAMTDVNKIDEKTLDDYYTSLLKLITAKSISSTTGADYVVNVKSLLRWAYRSYLIERMPRNVEGRTLEIERTKRKTEYLKTIEVHRLFKSANERTHLFLLLMLNCGMTQKDISDLTGNEVNWTTGLITRKRSKTKKHEGVPEVTWKLWPETIKLLRKYGNREGVVLLNKVGNRMVEKVLKDDGKPSSKDNIHSVWERMMEKVNESKPKLTFTPTDLRNTGATILNNNKMHRQYRQLYLGQAAKSIADKHYAVDHDDALDEALEYIYTELKIAELKL